MFEQTENRFKRACTYMSACFCTTYNMICTPDRSSEYLRFESLYRINFGDLFNKKNAIPATIINTAYKRGNIFCAGFRTKDSLPGRENKCAIRLNAIISKPFYSFYSILYHWYFNDNIRMNSG